MPYTIHCFRSWVADHTSWESLSDWLQSAEGGSLRIVAPNKSAYALVRYVKGQSDFTKKHVKWCRSVVVKKDTRLPVCVAPPKGGVVSAEQLSSVIIAEEFVDGTMINMFNDGDVNLATRSRIGGDGKFYEGSLTFKQMFDDAYGNHSYPSILPIRDDRPAVFASTVIQHPSNRIVKQITKPAYVIVHQGWTDVDGTVHIEEKSEAFRSGLHECGIPNITSYALNSIRGAKSVESWVAQQAQERGFGWQGVVLKDGTGNRWRVRSQVYETVRRIRGNESTHEERFARLRKARMVEQYLAFYPEDRECMYELEGRIRNNTKQLSHFYGQVFRAKKMAYADLPWPYKHHVSVLHNIYKDTLRKDGKKITFDEVVMYVNSLNQEDTYNMIKKHSLVAKKDTIKQEIRVEEPVTA